MGWEGYTPFFPPTLFENAFFRYFLGVSRPPPFQPKERKSKPLKAATPTPFKMFSLHTLILYRIRVVITKIIIWILKPQCLHLTIQRTHHNKCASHAFKFSLLLMHCGLPSIGYHCALPCLFSMKWMHHFKISIMDNAHVKLFQYEIPVISHLKFLRVFDHRSDYSTCKFTSETFDLRKSAKKES